MDTQAVIHFVGLVMFATQLVGPTARFRTADTAQAGVIAILPRVAPTATPNSTLRAKRTSQKSAALTATLASFDDIDPHVAWIIFRKGAAAIAPVEGWTVTPLNSDDNFEYVELNHDLISITVDGTNDPAKPPLGLPHMKEIGGTLRGEYRPPSYLGAAAVFDVPVGELHVCQSQAVGVAGRYDTELRLNSSGTITFRTNSKKLTLKADNVIYVVNVPPLYAKTHALDHQPESHYVVYCRMVGIDDGACSVAPKDACTACTCSENAQRRRATHVRDLSPPRIAELASFECSNTQYP